MRGDGHVMPCPYRAGFGVFYPLTYPSQLIGVG